jgi:uncharacterized membrane protein
MNLPPLHAAAVHLPLALIPLSVLAEWVGSIRNSEPARVVAHWSLMIGWVGTGAAVALGYVDLYRALDHPETVSLLPFVHLHLKIGWIIWFGVTVLAWWRLRLARQRAQRDRAYLSLATVVLALVAMQGWYGGELVYTGGLGVVPARRGLSDPVKAQQTLKDTHEVLSRVPGLDTETPPLGLEQRAKRAAEKSPHAP